MDEYIELADGTIIENAYIVKLDERHITAYVKGMMTFAQMSEWFADANKTKKMNTNQYGDKKTWNGFTTVTVIQANDYNAYACLQK